MDTRGGRAISDYRRQSRLSTRLYRKLRFEHIDRQRAIGGACREARGAKPISVEQTRHQPHRGTFSQNLNI
jgi:hypothetical protein